MSVYVDEMTVCLKSEHWPYSHVCHLVADSVEELHVFAGRLGLKRAWFQDRLYLPHYDLTIGKRLNAVRLGAIALDQSQFAEFMRKNRPSCAGD